jgi:hypothetical protein
MLGIYQILAWCRNGIGYTFLNMLDMRLVIFYSPICLVLYDMFISP